MNYTKTFHCGCTMAVFNSGEGNITYCPKHKAAPDMYEALKKAIVIIKTEHIVVPILCAEALAKAEGNPG